MPELKFYAMSDIGPCRKKNEDVFKIVEEDFMFTIADGMGGHKAGEIAAFETTNHLCSLLSKTTSHLVPLDKIIYHIDLAIKEVNSRVYNLSKMNQDFFKMGTTLCFLYFHVNHAVFAHIGDSRIYHFNKNKLTQLTKDHSLINKLKDQNKRHFNEKKCRNIITKAIGTHSIIKPSIDNIIFKKNDIFLMCTDGLSDYILKEDIEKIITSSLECKAICEKLINEAKKNGSNDNITCLVIKVI